MLKYPVYWKHQKVEQALQAMEAARRRTRAAAEAKELARTHEEIENVRQGEIAADMGSETVSAEASDEGIPQDNDDVLEAE